MSLTAYHQYPYKGIVMGVNHMYIVPQTGESTNKDIEIIYIGTMGVSTGIFTVLCLFYAVMDLTGRPAFLTQYKIQDNQPVIVVVRRILLDVFPLSRLTQRSTRRP